MLAPAIKITLRPGRIEDLPEVVALANACSQEAAGVDELTLEAYIEEWRDPSINLDTNTRVALLPDGRLAGCVEVWSSAPYIAHWLWGRVHPAQRGRGVGSALMDWAEARAVEQLALAPDGARVTTETAGPSNHQPTIDFMLGRGYEQVRHSLTMERALGGELPAPDWPEDITVRPFTPAGHLALYRAIDEIWQDHWGYVATPEDQGYPIWMHRMTQRPGFDLGLWFVAYQGDEIAGAALCYPSHAGDPELGWVSRLGVRRPWRRRSLGQALLYHAFGELRRRGYTRVGLGVDAQSLTGATRLYEKVGLRAVRSSVSFEKTIRPGRDLSTQAVTD